MITYSPYYLSSPAPVSPAKPLFFLGRSLKVITQRTTSETTITCHRCDLQGFHYDQGGQDEGVRAIDNASISVFLPVVSTYIMDMHTYVRTYLHNLQIQTVLRTRTDTMLSKKYGRGVCRTTPRTGLHNALRKRQILDLPNPKELYRSKIFPCRVGKPRESWKKLSDSKKKVWMLT